MVRDARFADIPAIVGLFRDAFARSHYAAAGLGSIDEGEAKRLPVQSIQRHGGVNGGSCFVQVAETDGIVTGVIVGTLARVYVIGDRLMATDLFWICHPSVDPRDPARLVRNMIGWAWSSPHVVEVRCGTTAIIQDPEKAGAILQTLGMQPYGRIYRKERA